MKKNIALIIVIAFIVGAIIFLESRKADKATIDSQGSALSPVTNNVAPIKKNLPVAHELTTPDGFINTEPITIASLIGKKVILIDFWTYSCINCQRTTPYLNSWYEKYKDEGLEIIGIHTPEFKFEENYENVKKAAQQMGIKFPVALDNDFSTWTAYGNRYWPRKYLIDIDGYIVYDHAGEGAYDETEKRIKEALAERMERLGLEENISEGFVYPTAIKPGRGVSPEIYFGSARNTSLANGVQGVMGEQKFANLKGSHYSGVQIDALYLGGSWDIQPEYAMPKSAGARVVFRYHAEQVYFVASAKEAQKMTVLRDGVPIDVNGGADVRTADGKSTVTISTDKLYHVVNEKNGYGEHFLELIFEKPTDVKLYTFTFG